MNKILKQKNAGFTLIELLVVIAIIAMLSSIVLVSLGNVRAKGRDAQRVSDLREYQKALEVYLSENVTLPTPSSYGENSDSPGWWNTWWDYSTVDEDGDGIYFMDFLVEGGFMPTDSVDPINQPLGLEGSGNRAYQGTKYVYAVIPKTYFYANPSVNSGSCSYQEDDIYFLGVTEMETDDFVSPGCLCLWEGYPNWYLREVYFDYIICNQFN